MNLYLVYVTDDKQLGNYRINQGKSPFTSEQKKAKAKQLIGDRPYIYLLADYPEEIEDKLREAGFQSKQEFIYNYSKIVN